MTDLTAFAGYLERWSLEVDGAVITTHSSALLPVRKAGVRLMLKLAHAEEEKQGGRLLANWPGGPVVQVLEHGEDAVLMPHADDQPSLSALSQAGRDDLAVAVLCDVAGGLHNTRNIWPDGVEALEMRFQALMQADDTHPIVSQAKAAADHVITTQETPQLLHGDIHHGNVLHFGTGGWLAIDPKGVIGDRAFDYANIFCNPSPQIACDRANFERRLAMVEARANLPRDRMALWVLAWCGLSAVWSMQDGHDPATALAVGSLAINSRE